MAGVRSPQVNAPLAILGHGVQRALQEAHAACPVESDWLCSVLIASRWDHVALSTGARHWSLTVPRKVEVSDVSFLLRAGGDGTDGVDQPAIWLGTESCRLPCYLPECVACPSLLAVDARVCSPQGMAQLEGHQAKDAMDFASDWLSRAGSLKNGDYMMKDVAVNSYDMLQLMATRSRKGAAPEKRVYGAYGKALKALNELGESLAAAGHWSPSDAEAARKLALAPPRPRAASPTPTARTASPPPPPPRRRLKDLETLPLATLPKFPFAPPPQPEAHAKGGLNILGSLIREHLAEAKAKCVWQLLLVWRVVNMLIKNVLVYVPSILIALGLTSMTALAVHLIVYPEKLVHLLGNVVDLLPAYLFYFFNRLGQALFADMDARLASPIEVGPPQGPSELPAFQATPTAPASATWSVLLVIIACLSSQNAPHN